MNKSFEHRLWTNEHLKEFGLKDILNEVLAPSFAANIFRLKILEKYGGIYIDADCQAVSPLDGWYQKYEKYPLSSIYIKNKNPDVGVIIAEPDIDYSIVLNDYKPIEPIGFYWQRMKPHMITEEEVGRQGTILKDLRMNTWVETYKNSLAS
jgi:hypothetical protein